MVKQFENTTIMAPTCENETAAIARLNDYGKAGWEVVAMFGNETTSRIWFKREIPDRGRRASFPMSAR